MRERDPDQLPSISALDDDRVAHPGGQRGGGHDSLRAPPRAEPASSRNGPLWAVCGALVLALIGLGYWTQQQQAQFQRQLVATQNSFAQISEEAAGRLQDISGKVSTTQSALSDVEQTRQTLEGLNRRLGELAARVNQQGEQAERGGATALQRDTAQQTRLDALEQRAATLAGRLDAGDDTNSTLRQEIIDMRESVRVLNERLAAVSELEQGLAAQTEQIAALRRSLERIEKQQSNVDVAQELMVIRSELDQRLSGLEQELRSVDAFRLQTNRSLTTLQEQMRTLQQQIAAP